MSKVFLLSQKNMRLISFTYLLLPLLIFLVGFLKPAYGIICGLSTIAVWWIGIRQDKKPQDPRIIVEAVCKIRLWEIILLILVCIVWCVLGGQGGYLYQTSDWNERNAIFRDLIERGWPVFYDQTNTVLTYYIGHWLPAALVGKAVLLITEDSQIAWNIGNNMLLLWSALGIIICILLLFRVSEASDFRERSIVLLIFIFFSGTDIVGTVLQGWRLEDYFEIMHLEWWAGGDVYQYSSITTSLFWVFNQAITAWVATLSFIHENRQGITSRNYGYIVVASLISAPLPTVGLFFLIAYSLIYSALQQLKKQKFRAWIRDLFSAGNIMIVLLVFPVLALYLFGNSAVENTKAPTSPPMFGKKSIVAAVMAFIFVVLPWFTKKRRKKNTMYFISSGSFILLIAYYMLTDTNIIYPLFILLDAGIFIILLFQSEKRNYLFHAAALLLLLAPLIKIGIGADFCMRASIPGLIAIMFLCAKRIIGKQANRDGSNAVVRSLCGLALTITLVIGAFTPMMEFYRSISKYNEGVSDEIHTLNKFHSSGGIYGNFVSDSYEKSLFFTQLTNIMEGSK